ncbi:helix-turn-helix domain-containing protein [Algoriphagus yeomjeoni]|uniref:AraC family transcriptional regulator n=1 Tax=Algoriphagus yeomjeoni TaxID=291403 RepID=A0A327PP85_9BACT|nr:AraC family transcriptional regulator [Algoriphagus yeomjeoni]RAI93938.1 AraC family transcriptional regulator [Algoriphagus yeomjeoni]
MPLIYVKNMVCPRCIASVCKTLDNLGLSYSSVDLGKIRLDSSPNNQQKITLAEKLKANGFELLEDGKSALISQIKSLLVDQIQHSKEYLAENYSNYIAEKLNHEYTYLSKLFSQVEGITIEKYITKLKIERVKELISYNEKNLSEVADLLNYSSVAYLSAQFKKETGMTPSEFRKQIKSGRKSLDQI